MPSMATTTSPESSRSKFKYSALEESTKRIRPLSGAVFVVGTASELDSENETVLSPESKIPKTSTQSAGK